MTFALILSLSLTVPTTYPPPPRGVTEPTGKSSLPGTKAYQTVRAKAWSAVNDLRESYGLSEDDVKCAWAMAALDVLITMRNASDAALSGQIMSDPLFVPPLKSAASALDNGVDWYRDAVREHCGPPSDPRAKRVASKLFKRASDRLSARREYRNLADLTNLAWQSEPEKFVNGRPYTPTLEEAALVLTGMLAPALLPYISAVVTAQMLQNAQRVASAVAR